MSILLKAGAFLESWTEPINSADQFFQTFGKKGAGQGQGFRIKIIFCMFLKKNRAMSRKFIITVFKK